MLTSLIDHVPRAEAHGAQKSAQHPGGPGQRWVASEGAHGAHGVLPSAHGGRMLLPGPLSPRGERTPPSSE